MLALFRERGKRSRLKIYLAYILAATLVVSIFAGLQFVFVLKHFEPRFLVVPVSLGIFIGSLFGKIHLLRAELQRQRNLFRAVAEFSLEFAYFRDLSGNYLYVTPSAENITSYSAEEFYQCSGLMEEIVHPQDRALWRDHVHEVDETGESHSIELRIQAKSGEVRWIQHLCGGVTDSEGKLIGVRSTNIDITRRKQAETRITHMANYDPLTDLPNRRYLDRHLRGLMQRAESESEMTLFAVLFVDLDRFKNINDTFGHSFGDRFLRAVSVEFTENLAKNVVVSRFGGDEFVMVTPVLRSAKEAENHARQLLALLERPVTIDDKQLHVSATIGISIYPFDGSSVDALIKNADAAMYKAKRESRRTYNFFTPAIEESSSRFLSMETRLREAIRDDQFLLHYQPQIDLRTGRLDGVECLLRWRGADGELLQPERFIPVAEEAGLMNTIGDMVLEKACEQWRIWHHELNYDLRIAINVSAQQLRTGRFYPRVLETLQRFELPAHRFELEITESMLLQRIDQTVTRLNTLREHGISVSIDDFGTGHSSLSYLRDLPADALKIDQSFVSRLAEQDRDYAVGRTIINLAHDFGLKVVAEGVEQQQQVDLLREMGCDLGQGYLFSRPLSAEELLRRLQRCDDGSARLAEV